jgi:hypothetical protein
MPKRSRRVPTPASEAAVFHALQQFHEAGDSPSTAKRFLDRIGFANFDNPAAVVAFSDPAARALRATLPQRPFLSSAVLERLWQCNPDDSSAWNVATSTYLWLAQCAGYAITAIPADWPQATELMQSTADMALNSEPYASRTLRNALLSHEACPDGVLYTAAILWPVRDALLAGAHPRASDSVRVAAALRAGTTVRH